MYDRLVPNETLFLAKLNILIWRHNLKLLLAWRQQQRWGWYIPPHCRQHVHSPESFIYRDMWTSVELTNELPLPRGYPWRYWSYYLTRREHTCSGYRYPKSAIRISENSLLYIRIQGKHWIEGVTRRRVMGKGQRKKKNESAKDIC
jgi:hypothetical protein